MPPTHNAPDYRSDESAAAFFDVDGTLVATHIVHQYLHVRKILAHRHGGALAPAIHALWLAAFYLKCLHYLYLDRRSRSRMNIAFYKNYGGLNSRHTRDVAQDCFDRVLKPHLFPQADRCVRTHLAAGRRVVLVTGSVEFMIEPLVRYFADVAVDAPRVELIARTLVEDNGVFTGDLDGPPIGEHEKATAVREYARTRGIDLATCYAYGDSIADLPMLELVEYPNAVNADRKLAGIARERAWTTHDWNVARNGA